MTVESEKVIGKKSKKPAIKPNIKAEGEKVFSSLDKLMAKIDAVEEEEQMAELFDEEDLLEKSFQSLLSLMGSVQVDANDDFDCQKVDENVMEIMSKFLDEGIIGEDEFEDFFTEELAEAEVEDEDDESEDIEDSEIDMDKVVSSYEQQSSGDEEEAGRDVKPSSLKSKSKKTNVAPGDSVKKSKNMRELEILMEKVDNESDLDDDDYETDDDEDEEEEAGTDYEEENEDKRDMFEEDKPDGSRLSSFEKSQVALKTEIAAIESEVIDSQKPWALRGEINARQRPSDSLLEEAVDFDSLARPTPQITEERTEEIEDIIKRRIGEGAWDDVERKDGRDLTLLNGMAAKTQKSARPLLEDVATAGPQRSLTKVYEDEATTQLTGHTALDEETREKQTELTALFAKICRHVDGLSGNRFAPKVYVQSDFQIKTLKK